MDTRVHLVRDHVHLTLLGPNVMLHNLCILRVMDLQNAGIEASSSDTITTDSGVGSETEVDTLEN